MDDPAGVGIRFLLYLDLMLLFGLPLFGLYGLNGDERSQASILRLRGLTLGLAVLGLLLSVAGLLLLAASMTGLPVSQVDGATLKLLLTGTAPGTAWQFRAAALMLAFLLPLMAWRRPGLALAGVALAGGIALATLAWTGHGAADEGARGWVHLSADILHLMASGVWIGALAALVMLIFRPMASMSVVHLELSHRALAEFSAVGTATVAILVVTGLINSWFLVGLSNVGAMVTAFYGQLLSAKLLLFAGMLTLAAANRFRLTPALEQAITRGRIADAVGALRRSLVAEAGAAILILALVAWLGTLSPPASGM